MPQQFRDSSVSPLLQAAFLMISQLDIFFDITRSLTLRGKMGIFFDNKIINQGMMPHLVGFAILDWTKRFHPELRKKNIGTQVVTTNYFVENSLLMPGTQIVIKTYHVEILLLSRSELFSQLACHYTSFGLNSQSFRHKPPWLFINIHQGIFIVFNKILNRCIKRSLGFTHSIIINNVASGTDSTASHR